MRIAVKTSMMDYHPIEIIRIKIGDDIKSRKRRNHPRQRKKKMMTTHLVALVCQMLENISRKRSIQLAITYLQCRLLARMMMTTKKTTIRIKMTKTTMIASIRTTTAICQYEGPNSSTHCGKYFAVPYSFLGRTEVMEPSESDGTINFSSDQTMIHRQRIPSNQQRNNRNSWTGSG